MRMIERIPADSFRSQAWANGDGRTRELAAGPDREHWRWRISIADVERDAAFSVLPGVHRQLAPLDGAIDLHFDDNDRLSAQRLEVLHFDGARECRCHLPDGPGRAINLMLREHTEGALMLRPLLDSMILLPSQGHVWFIVVVAGSCRLTADTEQLELATGDAAWIRIRAQSRALIEGGGELALIRLQR
ncbi:MAG TPA: HutD family protein [Oleiagrimonas sp.]|nr:HutD family protein [Oleiagrimonas sp.]